MTGILVRVGASLRSRRLASLVAATPGVRGSPGKSGMSATEPRWAPSSLRKGALRVDVALEVAVVARVGVDEAADGAVLGRDLGLDAAPGAAVAGDHDLALHVHPVAGQVLVVVGHAVVDVHQGGFHVAVDGVARCRSGAAPWPGPRSRPPSGRARRGGPRTGWAPSSPGAASSGWGRGRRTPRCARRSPRTGTARAAIPRCPCRTASPPRGAGRPGASSSSRRFSAWSWPSNRASRARWASEESAEKPRRAFSAVRAAGVRKGRETRAKAAARATARATRIGRASFERGRILPRPHVALAAAAGYRELVGYSRVLGVRRALPAAHHHLAARGDGRDLIVKRLERPVQLGHGRPL